MVGVRDGAVPADWKGFMETDLTESSFLDRGSLQPLIRLNSERINRLKDLSISYLHQLLAATGGF